METALNRLSCGPLKCGLDEKGEKAPCPIKMEDDVQCRGPCTQIMMEEFLIKSVTISIYTISLVAFVIWQLANQTEA